MTTLQDWLVLPTIVYAQFAGTSLWFAPNAVVSQIDGFGESQVAALVSCVQAGFILGTLSLTYFAATDRVSPPLLFTIMTLFGAALNVLCVASTNFAVWAVLRVLVGVCLAGVYPVGMTIAAHEYPSGLGARLGVLVGALTLGTGFPWLVRGLGGEELPVAATLATVSVLAVSGAAVMAMLMIPRQGGPGSECFTRMCCCWKQLELKSEDPTMKSQVKESSETPLEGKEQAKETKGETVTNATIESKQLMGLEALRTIMADSRFRAAALGYFGHMWELYAFWAHVPALIEAHGEEHGDEVLNVALTTFLTIGVGALSCTFGGLWSLYAGRDVHPGSAVVAEVSLMISGVCCLLAPVYQSMSPGLFLLYLLVWGAAVVADSGQFSSLCATFARKGLVGTALTLTTCIGFAITVVSIQLIGVLLEKGWDPGDALALLAIGPFLGIMWSYREWPLHRLLLKDQLSGANVSSDAGDEELELSC